jgi:cytochrome P450
MLFMVLRQHLCVVTEVNHEHTESRKLVRRLFEPGTEVAERRVIVKLQ